LLGGTVFALLSNNHLIAADAGTGNIVADHTLAPPPRTLPDAGQFLGFSSDHQHLFVLVPGTPGQVVVIGTQTLAIQAHFSLAADGITFRSLVVGSTTGHLYLFGNRVGSAWLTVLDPTSGKTLASWEARPAAGFDWWVFQVAVSAEERDLYISYHGPDTTGIDYFQITVNGLKRCTGAERPNVGCISAHGDFALYKDNLLIEYGDSSIIFEVDQVGRIQRAFDTRLTANHMLAFALNLGAGSLFALGDCGYAPGFSSVDLRDGGIVATPGTPGEWQGITTPTKAVTVQVTQGLCGSRLAVGTPPVVIIGRSGYHPPALLLVDGRMGKVLQTIAVAADPLDVIADRFPEQP